MLKIPVVMTGLALLLLANVPALAQAQKAAVPPKPALGLVDELMISWTEAGGKIIEMAQDFPADKYNYKPKPEVRSFAEQVLHVAGGNYLFLKAAKGEPWSVADGNPPRENYKTKADVVAYVKKSFADVVSYLKEQGDAGLAKPMKYPFGNRMIVQSAFWMGVLTHPSEHYGQLVVYYRLNGLVPPESRPRK